MLKGAYKAHVKPLLQRAMTEQAAIGWNFAFRGYLSYQWVNAQHAEHPKSSMTGIRQQWLKAIIRQIWAVTRLQWDERNRILHDATTSSALIRESSINSKVRNLYAVKDTFANSDQVLFSIPLQNRLQHRQRAKKLWLDLVSRYHPTTTAWERGQQPLITEFFQRQPGSLTEAIINPNNLQDPPNIPPGTLSPDIRLIPRNTS
jgi:hypothetical protein